MYDNIMENNITLEKLNRLREYAWAFDNVKSIKYKGENFTELVDYELFDVTNDSSEIINCLYIGDEVVQLSSALIPDKIRFNEIRTYNKCDRLYVAGGEQVTQIYGLNEILVILGIRAEIVDFTYFKPKNIYNLMNAFNSCNIKNWVCVDKLISKSTVYLESAFAYSNIDNLDLNNTDVSGITNAYGTFHGAVINKLDASFLSRFRLICNYRDCFRGCQIRELHLPNLMGRNEVEHMVDYSTIISTLYTTEAMYRIIRPRCGGIGQFIRTD